MGESGAAPRYWAFISYSHDDRGWARWLHRRLETYRVPQRLVGRAHWSGTVPRRLLPIFRDRDELPSSADLGGVVQRALADSRYLIVICSRHAAGSRWVNEEVETFKRLGREDRILCLKVDEPAAGNPGFPPALLRRYDAAGQPTGELIEPLAADVAPAADGREAAALKLIAGMLGVGYDELRRRERRRRLRERALVVAAGSALVALAGLGWHWQQTEKRAALDAQARQARIEVLYGRGRDELLAHREARAAVLLSEVYRLGVRTPALRYMLGRAMRVVDAQRLHVDTGAPVMLADLDPQNRQLFAIGEDGWLRAYARDGGGPLFDVELGDITAVFGGYSPRGNLIWVDSDHAEAPHRRLRIYAAADGRLLHELAANPLIQAASMQPIDAAERQIVYVDEQRALNLLAVDGVERRLAGDFAAARFCRGDRFVLVSRSGGEIELRDAQTLALHRRFDGLHALPTMLDSTDGCASVSAGTVDGAVRVWDVASGEVLMGGGHGRPITDLQLSPDGNRLMTTTRADMGVWNGRSGALVYASRLLDPIRNLASMQPDGRAVGRLGDGRLAILDPQAGTERYSLDAHRGGPVSFSFARPLPAHGEAEGTRLISGGVDGSVVVWDLPPMPFAEFAAGAATAIASRGDRLFVANAGGGSIWRTEPLRQALRLSGDASRAAAFSADGRRLALAGRSTIRVIDADSGAELWKLDDAGAPPLRLGFDGSGRYLMAAISGNLARLWDLDAGTTLASFARDAARAQAWSPREASFAFGAQGVVRLWDLASAQLRWSTALPGGDRSVGLIAFSDDGRRILATAMREHAYILDAASGRILQTVREPASANFNAGAFSPGGGQVILGDGGKAALLWDLGSRALRRLVGHTAGVRSASFSGDGALVVTAGEDGVVKIWDARRAELIDSIVAHDGAAPWDYVSFSTNDRYLLSGGADAASRLWDVRAETRSPAAIASLLRCRVNWHLDGTDLLPASTAAEHCALRQP